MWSNNTKEYRWPLSLWRKQIILLWKLVEIKMNIYSISYFQLKIIDKTFWALKDSSIEHKLIDKMFQWKEYWLNFLRWTIFRAIISTSLKFWLLNQYNLLLIREHKDIRPVQNIVYFTFNPFTPTPKTIDGRVHWSYLV